ncbi:hypothetical protein [Haloarcula salinisoli]|uniref:Uncharacterized protein n=1 Tax=Haloarcula salinisoli TaxID=2487746 RepID=A0A8J8C779_9EURY|nr:hypothetical protein [Halomicroarcula salinisoli]MBX0285465.1 hypothetical protein [Halomicroarcula salinisoli]MBX0303056.1 hypothetical protein [Halomicroarcula salinisoli]
MLRTFLPVLAKQARQFGPDEEVPIRRIARYACYALVVVAGGLVVATVVGELLLVFRVLMYTVGEGFARTYVDLVFLIQRGISAFAALVALGVFMTQFESR